MKFLRKTNGKLDVGFIVGISLLSGGGILNLVAALTISTMPWVSIAVVVYVIFHIKMLISARLFWQDVEEMEQDIAEMEQGVEGFGRDIEELRVWLSKESK